MLKDNIYLTMIVIAMINPLDAAYLKSRSRVSLHRLTKSIGEPNLIS